ncbi:uracil-xanthine permease family protein [Streptomyces sp. H10-C2]|uniref:uracil-xanthine permease family protein n=1 Tax=unclassified Streptomyces TaxID=2593676 RepID=UPI0024BB2C55|nr:MULTISPECIES: uracil-xanthine permease family protein [unclassified Streptomyces]MDJ0345479.1 uracil-xanthine permease family protein [Streptomyces sp. PH10-H1]MDJ0371845.1 uracil-xanthine permease family protein [Streptomyces sp. H10-C2]
MSIPSAKHPVDECRPLQKMLLFGIQHVLVMAATPISSVFLVSATLGLSADLTVNLLSAAFVLSGVGTLLQSLGPWGVGSRLPFVMLPGGAPLVLFLAIAQEHGVRTATGAVILTGVFYFVVLPVFSRLLKFFPTLVIGTMIVIVGVNLVKVGALLVTGKPGSPAFGDTRNLLLGLATIGFIIAFYWLFTGVLRQLAVMLGLVTGTALAFLLGGLHSGGTSGGGLLHMPQLLPFGTPQFSLLASLPLLLYSLASMAEATGQTVINGEAVGKETDARRDAPKTIRGDAVVSFLGGFFGLPLMVTSGENIGIVRITGVRSRFVTVAAGLVLIVIGVLAPITRVIIAIPSAVVGGTAMVVFGVVAVLGMQMLSRSHLDDHTNTFICAVALALGLLPILIPGVYGRFSPNIRILLESGVAVGAFTAALLNALFHHVRSPFQRGSAADRMPTAGFPTPAFGRARTQDDRPGVASPQ